MTHIFHDARTAISALDSGRLAMAPSSPLVAKWTNESPRAAMAKLSTTTSASRTGSGSCVRARRALLDSAAEAPPRVVRAEDASVLSAEAAVAAVPLDTASATAAARDRAMAQVVVCVTDVTAVQGEGRDVPKCPEYPSGCDLMRFRLGAPEGEWGAWRVASRGICPFLKIVALSAVEKKSRYLSTFIFNPHQSEKLLPMTTLLG